MSFCRERDTNQIPMSLQRTENSYSTFYHKVFEELQLLGDNELAITIAKVLSGRATEHEDVIDMYDLMNKKLNPSKSFKNVSVPADDDTDRHYKFVHSFKGGSKEMQFTSLQGALTYWSGITKLQK